MTDLDRPDSVPEKAASTSKWAPWWIYLIVLLGANYVRSFAMAGSSLPEFVVAAIAIGQAALLFVVVTAIWRLGRRDKA